MGIRNFSASGDLFFLNQLIIKVDLYPVDCINCTPSVGIKGNAPVLVDLFATTRVMKKIIRYEPEFCGSLNSPGSHCCLFGDFYRVMRDGDARGLFFPGLFLPGGCSRNRYFFSLRWCEIQCKFPVENVGEYGLPGVPHKFVDTPMDTVFCHNIPVNRKKELLAGHLMIVYHEAVICFVELADQVTVI